MPRVLAAALALAASPLSGCRCDEDRPYTPFGVASVMSGQPQSGPSGSAPPAASSAAAQGTRAVPATDKTRSAWPVGDASIAPPPHTQFAQALTHDFDGDEKLELIAWVTPTESDKPRQEELWRHHQGKWQQLSELPGFVPTAPDCPRQASLSLTGPHTVTLDVSAHCKKPVLARSPVRSLQVFAPLEARPRLLSLRLAEAAPGDRLSVSVNSKDRDDDGRDDVELTLGLEGPAGPMGATLSFAWLDRAAGVARDPNLLRTSHQATAAKARSLSRASNSAKQARALVDNLRRLLGFVCSEGGVPRLFDVEGRAMSCGSLAQTVDACADAEVSASLKDNDVLGALSALGHDGWYFGRSSSKLRQQLEQRITAVVQPRKVRTIRPGMLSKQVSEPSFSPLDFDGRGLWVQAPDGTLKLLPPGGEPETPASGRPPWPLEAQSPERRLAGVIHSCDRDELALLFTGNNAGTLPTDKLAARPGSCAGGPAPAAALVLDRFSAGVVGAFVATTPVGATYPGGGQVPAPGTPRSKDGKWLVLVSELGVLVSGDKKHELWQPEGVALGQLSHCVVEKDAARVACLEQQRNVVVLTP